MPEVIDLTKTETELEKLKAENSKMKRLLSDLMGKADFDYDADTILIYHDTKEDGDIAYEAMKELGGIFCEKWAKKKANKRPKIE